MTDALKATYADLKTVKTRGVCQIVLEMPIEAMADAFALLGAPVPGNEVWVAIARLREGRAEPEKKGTLAQQAGILCNDAAFRRYLADLADKNYTDADSAAQAVRQICGVESRSDLDRNDIAARKFRDLKADFKAWLSGVAA